jgi:hypothetical protein
MSSQEGSPSGSGSSPSLTTGRSRSKRLLEVAAEPFPGGVGGMADKDFFELGGGAGGGAFKIL